MGNNRPPDEDYGYPQPGMMDDEYWMAFSSSAEDYELGPAIGFGASSTVYSAMFTPPASTYRIASSSTTPTLPAIATATSPPSPKTLTSTPITKHSPEHHRKPNLTIALPVPPHALSSSAAASASGDVSGAGVGERPCAIKVSSSHPDVELLFKEIRLLALCRHPNVLRILATFTLPPDNQRIALVTPLVAGGSLAGILDWRARLASTPKTQHFFRVGHRKKHDDEDETTGRGGLEEEEVKAVAKQVLEGLRYLHENGFLHRDLKAGNLLLGTDGTVLLADFGVGGDMNLPPSPTTSKSRRPAADELRFEPGEGKSLGPGKVQPLMSEVEEGRSRRMSFVGTPNWMAPEVVLGRGYDTKADIWSLGITVLELAHGVVPGAKQKNKDVLARIIAQAPPTLDRERGKYSKHMKEFVEKCLVKDPAGRPTAAQLLEHPWLKSAKKKGFLAQALLHDVPLLTQRQELRRVPTMSSFVSRASSWDFTSPSIPASPMRSSLVVSSARSPSLASYKGEYFSPRTHSRNSSYSVLPPSPRVPLRQWALEGSTGSASGAGQLSESPISTLAVRTGSERGKSRSGSLQPGSGVARKTASFDLQRPRSTSGSLRTGSEGAGAGSTVGGPSPMRRGRELRVARSEDDMDLQGEEVRGLGIGLGAGMALGAPMSPLLEVTRPGGGSPSKTILPSGARRLGNAEVEESISPLKLGERRDVFSSPESTTAQEAGPPSKGEKSVSPRSVQGYSTPPAEVTGSLQLKSTGDSTPVTPRASQTDTPVEVPLSRTETFLSRISSRTAVERERDREPSEKEKRGWLGRKPSGKKAEKVSGMTASGTGEKVVSHHMGRTASWGAVLGKVTGKKR
ncbi:hypothetical protein IAT38_008007 [Cryptococcus sp. DSM 104549]